MYGSVRGKKTGYLESISAGNEDDDIDDDGTAPDILKPKNPTYTAPAKYFEEVAKGGEVCCLKYQSNTIAGS